MKKIHRERLLKVAQALRESSAPKDFTMRCFVNECGTPACALGHYAARRDLQHAFKIVVEKGTDFDGTARLYYDVTENDGAPIAYDDDFTQQHFGLDAYDLNNLFGGCGCDDAQTPKAAARYIERFVAKQERA